MKKIQISTVQKQAEVQVINVNASIIARTIRAEVALKNALRECRKEMYENDEKGNVIVDEDGKPIVAKDQNGNIIYKYNPYAMDLDELKNIYEIVLPFIEELAKAFEDAD